MEEKGVSSEAQDNVVQDTGHRIYGWQETGKAKDGKISQTPRTHQSCRNSSGQVGQNMEMDEAGLHRSFVIEQHRVFMPLCCKLGDSFIPYLFILSYLFTIQSRVWISSNYIRNVNAWIIESSRRDHDGLRQPLPSAVLRRIAVLAQVLLRRIADDSTSTRVAENSR